MEQGLRAIPGNEFKLLQRSIHNQRYQMELTLETMPREVYSNQLMEAMRKEEMAVRDGVKITTEMSKNIDDALRGETRKFFLKIVSENMRRWTSLQVKVDNEYARFYQGSRSRKRDAELGSDAGKKAAAQLSAVATAAAPAAVTLTAPAAAPSEPTPEELDQEVNRLEEDYQRQWLSYELGNLRTAFASQMERVESEWSTHEQSMTDDFNKKTISEKIGHNRQKESSSNSLQKKQFAANLEHLHTQKAASQRWMCRQEMRLSAQATEIAAERVKIADYLAMELTRAKERTVASAAAYE